MQAEVRTAAGGPAPVHGRRGQLVTYTVELRNPNQQATIGFGRCPVFGELLAPGGAAERHPLNCAGAQPIPPGGTLRFAMQVRVPSSAPLGPNGLFWALDVTSARPLEVVSRLIVDG